MAVVAAVVAEAGSEPLAEAGRRQGGGGAVAVGVVVMGSSSSGAVLRDHQDRCYHLLPLVFKCLLLTSYAMLVSLILEL